MNRGERRAFGDLLDLVGDSTIRLDYRTAWWNVGIVLPDGYVSNLGAGGSTLRSAIEDACRAARRLSLGVRDKAAK